MKINTNIGEPTHSFSTDLYAMEVGKWHLMIASEGQEYFVMRIRDNKDQMLVVWQATGPYSISGWCIRSVEDWAPMNRTYRPLHSHEYFEVTI